MATCPLPKGEGSETATSTFARALAAVLVLAWTHTSLADEPRQPNVIVIVADDLGYGDLSVHGCQDIPTPHIDSLAANGVRCTNGYVSHPYCSPTRAGLMTARYQQRFGHEYNVGPINDRRPGIGLPLSEHTMADRFKDAGYTTGIVGKWHLGHAEDKFHPLNRGFEEFFGFLSGSHSYLRWGAGHDAIFRDRTPLPNGEYLTDAFGREGVAFIKRHADKPFFLYWPFNAVHGPMEASAADADRFPNIEDANRRTYAGMLARLDDAVGQGLAALRQAGIEDDTLIFFISDNGGPEEVNSSDNGPFRGGKGTTYEGGIRVPFFVQWKAKLPAGKVYDESVIQLDILPTALAAGGIDVEPTNNFDGVDLLPYLAGEKDGSPHDALYWRAGSVMAIRQGDWKLVRSFDRGRQRGEKRSAEPPPVSDSQLFNLASDSGEQTDLAAENPEKLKELESTWQAWNGQLVEPLWQSLRRPNRKAARKRAPTG